jgi:DNA-binding NtrC family response regulator
MVVDDDEEFLRIAREAMPKRTVLIECDARRVLERVEKERPDLVIVDQWLNGNIYGHELTDALKSRDPDLLVAVWSSGFDVVAMQYLAKYTRADHVDIKTYDFERLIDRVTGKAAPPEPNWRALPCVDEMRSELAERTLARCAGNKSAAARRLGVDRTTFMRWLRASRRDD